MLLLCILIHVAILPIRDLSNITITIIGLIILLESFISIFVIINCDRCNSFKNVVAHEFGHILGFAHPDQYFYLNWRGTYKNCILSKYIDNNYDKKSIMISVDTNLRYKTEISSNDLLGMTELYPDCAYKSVVSTYKPINDNNKLFFIITLIIWFVPIIAVILDKILLKLAKNEDIEEEQHSNEININMLNRY